MKKKIWEQINRDNWGRGEIAVDKAGKRVSVNSEDAARMCALGWLSKCYPDSYSQALRKLLAVLPGVVSISRWNDSQPEVRFVRKAFKKADL